MPAAENVNVKVVHRLAAVGAAVENDPIAVLQLQLARQIAANEHEMADERGVFFRYAIKVGDFLFGN